MAQSDSVIVLGGSMTVHLCTDHWSVHLLSASSCLDVPQKMTERKKSRAAERHNQPAFQREAGKHGWRWDQQLSNCGFERYYRNKRCSCHKISYMKLSFDVLKMRKKCQTLATVTEEVSDGRSEKSQRKNVSSANRNRPLYLVWSVCVKTRWKRNLLYKDKLQPVPRCKETRGNWLNCANIADTYLGMWWLEPALWTLHTQENDKSNLLLSKL